MFILPILYFYSFTTSGSSILVPEIPNPLKIRTKFIVVIIKKLLSDFIVAFKTPKSADHNARAEHRLSDGKTQAATY